MVKKIGTIIERFGETIISLGFATSDDLQAALAEQKARESRGEKPILIGMLMVKMGVITLSQFVTAINSRNNDLNFILSEDAVRIVTRVKSLLLETDKVISLSSAVENEGVSSLVSQFAIALALIGDGSILLIDAHPDKSSLHKIFRLPQSPGLFEILEKKQDYQQLIQETSLPTLSLLTIGQNTGSSYQLFLSETFPELIREVRSKYRYILIDTPPFLKYPESAVVASRTDGVVLLIASGKRNKSEILEVKRSLDGLRVKLFGYVFSEFKSASIF